MPDNELPEVHNLLLSITGDNDKLPKPFCSNASKALCSKQRSPTFNRHFGVVSVNGRKREAIPAANITAFIVMQFF